MTFDADPGPLQLRLAVQGERGETLDTEIRDVKVPDLTAAQVGLSTPAVFRSGNAREFQALTANPAPVPTASREFRRTERLLVRFDAYAPGTEVPVVTAQGAQSRGQPDGGPAGAGAAEPRRASTSWTCRSRALPPAST